MHRLLIMCSVVLALVCGQAAAQLPPPPPKKDKLPDPVKKPHSSSDAPAAIPGEVEIHFFNGSTVRMIVQSEKLEIATLYGKLTVPVKDIRTVEFGLHFTEGTAAKIAAAAKNLGSANFQDREEASKTLIELGPFSYPAVYELSRDKDVETSRRAQEIVKKLQAKHPRSDLKSSTDDRVVTSTFTIVGRILTPTVKAKAEYFGEIELSLANMRNLKAVGGPSIETVVSIDAGKYGNANQWLDSKFRVDGSKTTLVISAKGIVDLCPQDGGQYLVGPMGYQQNRARFGGGPGGMVAAGRKVGVINPQAHGGMLIGRVGEDGEPFTIGENCEIVIENEGTLYLHIGPSPFHCPSSGAFEVKISRKN